MVQYTFFRKLKREPIMERRLDFLSVGSCCCCSGAAGLSLCERRWDLLNGFVEGSRGVAFLGGADRSDGKPSSKSRIRYKSLLSTMRGVIGLDVVNGSLSVMLPGSWKPRAMSERCRGEPSFSEDE